MNKKKSIWSGVSVLIAAVLAIVAFVRSDTQIWLLTAAFTIWAIWVTAAFVFPYIQEQENEKRRAARRAAYNAQRQSLRALSVEEEDGFGPLLLRHVNHRISAYLKAVYPDAAWEWRSPEPEKLILHGGTGRITISGIPDYDQAEVTFDQNLGRDFSTSSRNSPYAGEARGIGHPRHFRLHGKLLGPPENPQVPTPPGSKPGSTVHARRYAASRLISAIADAESVCA